MRVGRGWLVAVLMAAPILVIAAPPPAPQATSSTSEPTQSPRNSTANSLRPKIDQLIALLGHEKFIQRVGAMDGLEKLGPIVLPQLQEAINKPPDPEVRRRLEEVILKLETAGALNPSLINLKVTDKPIRKIVEEIGRQSGYKVELWPPGGNDERDKRTLTLELKDATFWQALQQVCDLGGLNFQDGWYGNDNMTIRLQSGDAIPGFICLEGPFRVVARGMNYFRNMDFATARGNNPLQGGEARRTESLTLNMSITVEPRLPLYGVGAATITEALDDLGQSLKPAPAQQQAMRQSYYSGYRGYMQHVNVTLNPMPNGRRIKSLKGTIPVTLIALQRPKIVIDKLGELKNHSVKSGSTTLVIEEATKNGNQVTLKLNISEAVPRGAQQDYSWVNTVIQRIEVQDEQGAKLQSFSSSWGMNGNGVQGTFTYGGNAGAGAPHRLIYYDWITRAHDVPFTFQDLPLP